MSQDVVLSKALHEVKRHGLERELLVALLREQAKESDIRFDGLQVNVAAREVNPARGAFNISQARHGDDFVDHVAVHDRDALDLILSLARFLPGDA